jgi:hypothetical protein
MGKAGTKSQRGVGEIYDELKTEQTIILLTPTGKKGLDALAKSFGLSRSEFVERLARGVIEVVG